MDVVFQINGYKTAVMLNGE